MTESTLFTDRLVYRIRLCSYPITYCLYSFYEDVLH